MSRVATRAICVIGLDKRRISSTAVGSSDGFVASFFSSAGYWIKREQTTRDRIARRFQSTDDIQKAVMEQFTFGQLAAVDLRVAKHAEQIFAIAAAPFERELARNTCQDSSSLLAGFQRGTGFDLVFGIRKADGHVTPLEHVGPVTPGNTHDFADERHRQPRRDIHYKIALATIQRVVQNLRHQFLGRELRIFPLDVAGKAD